LNSREIDTARPDAENKLGNEGFSTLEASAVKKIVRESWESRLKEKGTALDILNEHMQFMNRELDAIDYESLCMQVIAQRAKHMSRGELLAYTKTIEALALGYKSRFGADFSALLIAGVTLVSKDLTTVRKHLDYFLAHLSKGAGVYEKRIEKELCKMSGCEEQIKLKDKGIFRFLRKKEIAVLRKRIRVAQAKIKKLEGRKSRYVSLAEQLKAKTGSNLAKRV
jgi:hypothetical protein